MIVNEIFRSIQGESSYVGKPCVFVRLTGCNLRCSYCDTKYAYKEGKKMSVNRVFRKIAKIAKVGDIIEITGGEPLLQKEDIKDLISEIYSYDNYPTYNDLFSKTTILIETNGSVILPDDLRARYIMDWKLPSSGMSDKMEYVNLERIDERDELKFVIENSGDYDEMKRILDKYKPGCHILVSTIWNKELNKSIREEVVERMLEDGIKARFQIQLHKEIWDPKKRGV